MARRPPKTSARNTSEPADPVTAWAKDVVAGRIVQGPHVRNTARRHLADLRDGRERGLHWDLAAAQRAFGFFHEVLCLAGGQFEGTPFRLHPSQMFIVGSLFGWKKSDGFRRFRRVYLEIAKGNGKALALDTPIPTPAGWSAMGDLRVGDLVLDELGAPCRVTAATDVMTDRECYAVVFDDGARIVADAGHLWATEMRRAPAQHAFGLRTTAEIAATLRYRNGKYQSANHSVALCAPLDLPDVELPIPPYTLGAWLADGDTDAARLTVPISDWQIVDEINAEGEPTHEQKRHAPHIARISLSAGANTVSSIALACLAEGLAKEMVTAAGIVAEHRRDRDRVSRYLSASGMFELVRHPRGVGEGGGTAPAVWRLKTTAHGEAAAMVREPARMLLRLRAAGLLGNKHIPTAYLRASHRQRLALLHGLMDGDGSIAASGQCELTTIRCALAEQVAELVASLGLKAFITEGRATLDGRDVGAKYRVGFTAPAFPVFRLARKLARQVKRHDRRPLSADRRIIGCDRVASVPVRCISVDSPSRMFLAGRQMVPTHNSPMLAGIGLYCMLADGEARAEVYAAGSKKDQAMVQFRQAVAMVDQSPGLARRLVKSGSNPIWNLADLRTGSFFRPIASADGQSGPSPHCALCDEVHEYHDAETMEILERGFKWRRQPMLVMATNSGSDRNSVCWRQHDHAVKVAAGTRTPDEDFAYVGEVIDDETFSFVCALDRTDDPLTEPGCWIKANPLLGVTVQPDYIAGVVRQAAAIPGTLNGILRLHFCVWTDAAEAWMSRATLEPLLADFDPEEEHAGADVYLGLDLSGSQDLSVLAAVVQTGTVELPRDDGSTAELPTFDAWIEAWTPRDTMHERALRDQAPYDVWAEQGFLHAETGKTIRLDFIAARLAAAAAIYRVIKLAYDAYSYRKLEEVLDELGLTLPQVEHPQGGRRRAKASEEEIEEARRLGVPAPQGLWMPGSLLETEKLFLEGRIRLCRNPVLISAIMSAVLERDPFDNRWFSKRRAVNRIDAVVALAMAIGAATAGTVTAPSVYETRGILVL